MYLKNKTKQQQNLSNKLQNITEKRINHIMRDRRHRGNFSEENLSSTIVRCSQVF